MIKKRLKIYVENSVISAYHFAPRLIAAATRRFFEKAVREKYELFTLDVTIAELEKTDRDVREGRYPKEVSPRRRAHSDGKCVRF